MLNPTTVHDLRELLGDSYDHFISEYVSVTDDLVNQIVQKYGEKDYDTIRKFAHSIKSSSAQVGADHVAEVAREIETCKGDVEEYMIRDLKAQFAAVKASL